VGEGLALEGDEDGIGGGEPVDGEDPERGWAVDQYQVVLAEHRLEGPFEHVLPAGAGEEVHLGPGQIDGGRQDVEIGNARDLQVTSATKSRRTKTSCNDRSSESGSNPSEKVRQACGSRSTTRVRLPNSADATPSECTVVVLATPPF
jgi:hypothetical protein